MDNSPTPSPNPDDEFVPVVRMEEGAVRRIDAGTPLSPYGGFSIPDTERDNVAQVDALLADPEIAGYIRGDADTAWTRRRVAQCAAGLLATAACLAALVVFLPGNMLRSYAPPVPQDTPKPQPYPEAAMLPILYRDNVREINADINAGNRWQSAGDKLRRFIADADAGAGDPPAEVRNWALAEMLVILASKEIPPGVYEEDYPDKLYADLKASPPAPFRAGTAYARLLAARPVPKDEEKARAQRAGLIAILDQLRNDYPDLMDKNRDLLVLEAEQHVLQFPKEYGTDNRYLDYHWRRAAHAIVRLYDLFGKRDATARQLDRRRWQAVNRYFGFTLFTLDAKRLGRLKEITLDGVPYPREQVRAELEKL